MCFATGTTSVGMKGRILLSVLLIAANYATAQVPGTQYFMNSLPQYVTNNPAFVPKYKFAMGLPGSMVEVNYFNNGFAYNDLIQREGGRRVTSPLKLSNVVPARTYITGNTQVDLFRLGMQIGDNSYLSLNSSVRGYSRTMIPKEAVAIFGGGNNPYAASTQNISMQSDMTFFWENSVGFAIEPVENFTVGARVKILRGFVNAQTLTANAAVYNSHDSVTLAATMNSRTSGIQNRNDDFHLSNYSGNNGFAVDLGATYKPVDRLTLAFSLLDLGSINWKRNLYQYTLDPSTANYRYTKSDLDKTLNKDEGAGIVDTLKSRFKPQERQGSPYSTVLPAKMLVSADYDFEKNLSVGAMFFAQRYMDRISSGMTLAMNKHFGKVISTTLSYSIYEKTYNNFGAGLSLNFTPIQIYAVSDNINGLINPKSAQTLTLRGGVNIVWGWKEDAPKRTFIKASPERKKAASNSADLRKRGR